MIGRSLSTGSSTLFVRGNREKEFQIFRTEVAVRGHADLMPKNSELARPWKEFISGIAVGVTRCIETVVETPGKSGKNLGQKITGTFPPKNTARPLKKEI